MGAITRGRRARMWVAGDDSKGKEWRRREARGQLIIIAIASEGIRVLESQSHTGDIQPTSSLSAELARLPDTDAKGPKDDRFTPWGDVSRAPTMYERKMRDDLATHTREMKVTQLAVAISNGCGQDMLIGEKNLKHVRLDVCDEPLRLALSLVGLAGLVDVDWVELGVLRETLMTRCISEYARC
ncbi:hypothetical protein SAICODRAFT_23797 [Saitoella complicata NRRL Y-17804]|uniref:uncharacterized protein n=1 Tax=Saitoella complicata (strain BCRC 22490 / CBS 7301 / JCM 7358 / NBRC 10748 / NRRL Y-17804) TaxID=698492 RepID=UPI00086807E8|nr:uncharacterized protein SAICODRAFT_23797 [Saitoella complicata NRRL Y-17804]ODQ55129.1 hypothetical protein SAICODRAFT_23797 [Saitoella complicata NRRL Y-17804]